MESNGFQLPRGTRIAHLIESDGPGGAEQIVAGLVHELAKRGFANTVFLPARGEGWLAAQLERSDAEVIPFSLRRPLSPRFALWLGEALGRSGADIAHSHEFTMAFYGALAARTAGVPHVITMHGSRYFEGNPRRRIAMRLATELSGRTIAVSGPLRGALLENLRLPASEVEVILNGASALPPERPTLRGELHLGAKDELAVTVANLYPVKGHTNLLSALALISADHPRLHLALAGRGGLEATLSRQAADLGIEDRVHFLGLRSDIPNLLASADLFVLPSLSEGLPLALLEAMLAGTPALATAVGNVPEVLGHGELGSLVPPGDASSLANAIRRVLEDPEGAAVRAYRARREAEKRFSVGHMVDSYLSLYGKLFARAG